MIFGHYVLINEQGTGRNHGARVAVFLDRDGVLVENRTPYILKEAEIQFIEGSAEALTILSAAAYELVIVTNQAAVAKNLISDLQAWDIQQYIVTALEGMAEVSITSYMCLHAPYDGCRCRKPRPGMLMEASRKLGIDLTRSYLVGDAITDAEAAQQVGVRPLFVATGRGDSQYRNRPHHILDAPIFPSILEAAKFIVEHPRP